MIISWFTDPSKGTFNAEAGDTRYSSYYQYDTDSKQFTRIRLELGRNARAGTTDEYSGGAKEMYHETRYISFSSEKLDSKKWSVDDGKLLYNGKALGVKPVNNDYVYDTSGQGAVKPHSGNPVTDSPNLPEGIELKHLSLLANDTFINKDSVNLTKRVASADELIEALKTQVGEVMGKKFEEIDDDELLDKLKSQVSDIKKSASADLETKLNESIESVKTSLNNMTEKISKAAITPDEKFETATKNAFSCVEKAQSLAKSDDIKKAISNLNEAKTSLEMADATCENPVLAESLTGPTEALQDAMKASNDWTAMQEQYETLESSDSIESYESEIGVESTPEENISTEAVTV